MSDKPRSKRHQTLMNNLGGEDQYRKHMKAIASKGGQAKVPKGWAITKNRIREEVAEYEDHTRQ